MSALLVFALFVLKTMGAGRGIGEGEDSTELAKLGIGVDYVGDGIWEW